MRTIVDIPEDLLQRVDRIAERKKWSRAEAVRQGLARIVAEDRDEVERVLAETAGAWKDLNIDGLEYQRAIRAEWHDDEAA